MLKRIMALLMSVVMLCGLFGCGNENTKTSNKVLYKATDARGKTIEFTAKPQRIVSLSLWGDEILLDLVDHKRIAGMDKWVHDPSVSNAVESAKDVKNIVANTSESVLKVDPDLILLASKMANQNTLKTFEDVGRKVFVYDAASNVSEIPTCISSIASAVGEKEQGKKLITKFNADLEKAKEISSARTGKTKALGFLKNGAYGGKGTILYDVLTNAGFVDGYNEVRNTPKGNDPRGFLSKEEVVKVNPDVIIIGHWNYDGKGLSGTEQLNEMYKDPAYATINAIKNKKAYVVPQKLLVGISHHTGENILELLKITGK